MQIFPTQQCYNYLLTIYTQCRFDEDPMESRNVPMSVAVPCIGDPYLQFVPKSIFEVNLEYITSILIAKMEVN